MQIRILSVFLLLSVGVLSGCNSANQPTGQSQVRQAPSDNTSTDQQQGQYNANQSMTSSTDTTAGEVNSAGTAGTGGRNSSLGSSGGSPYITPTGGNMVYPSANSGSGKNRSAHNGTASGTENNSTAHHHSR